MKKVAAIILISCLWLFSSCQTEMVTIGVREYDPDADEPESIHVDFAYYNSPEDLVRISDVIAVASVDTLKYVKVDFEDDSISESRGMYAELFLTDVLHTSKKSVADGLTLNVYIEYDPDYENIAEPGIEEGGEYMFFLAEFEDEASAVFRDFFDYYVISDFGKFKIEPTDENIAKFNKLIKSIR